jgi:hypothetical protein
MYAFVLKNCLLPNEFEYFTEEKDCYVRQITSLGERSNIQEIIEYFSNENKIKFKSDTAQSAFVEQEARKIALQTPCAVVVVNRKYDYSFIENTIFILSYFQRFPVELFCILGEEEGRNAFEFYPRHSFPAYKAIIPDKFYEFYKIFNNKIGKYKYILKLFFEANKEVEIGYKITKYYSILETLAGGVGFIKIKEFLEDTQNNQPLIPDVYNVDLTEYRGKLYDSIVDKKQFSYIELMAAYRHLVVHFGVLHPTPIKDCFESNQDMIFLLQRVVENLIKLAILND